MTKYFEIIIENSGGPNYAFVDPDESVAGLRRIYLGCNMSEGRFAYSQGWAHTWVYEKYGRSSADNLIEQQIEVSLTHEVLHILCAQFAPAGGKLLAGEGVDYIDKEECISSLD